MELYLVDTNVLLRLANPEIELHTLSQSAIAQLLSRGCKLHYTLQNAAEFWNVSTRPLERNGHGTSPHATARTLNQFEERMTLLPDDHRVYAQWRKLVTTHNVRGVQVHDARLAASMLAHSIPHILTFNTADFSRYPRVQAIHPATVTVS